MFLRSLVVVACLLAPLLAQAQVRRGQAMAIAETYLKVAWKPSPKNAFHGRDAQGIRVDTPDLGFHRPDIRRGWWRPGEVNHGMPYMWGGFDTPAEFARGVRRGAYAGDVCTAEKRRLGDAAVSRHAVGIDCSGLVSRCWKLERAYSTRELPRLCQPLRSYRELKAGDILNAPDKHVLIFREFSDESRTRIRAYEAGSPPTWKVLLNEVPVSFLEKQGYAPLRYARIKD